LHTLPALSDAQAAIPHLEVDWVVEENFAEIPQWHSAVKRVIPIALRRWRKEKNLSALNETRAFFRLLRLNKYACIIDAQGLLKSALVSFWAHGPSYGLDFKSAREPLASLFYKHKIAVAKNQHAIDRIRELFAQTLKYDIKNPVDYGIKNFFKASPSHEKYWVFVHGTARTDKCLPETQWIELAKRAKAQGFAVKLPCGNDVELQRAERIATAVGEHVQVLPKMSLYDLAMVFLRAYGVIAIDTGLGHLAAALDVPVTSLYQTTDPKLIGTIGAHCTHISHRTSRFEVHQPRSH